MVQINDEEGLAKKLDLMSKEQGESYAQLRERVERLALILEGTNYGIWDWNLKTNEIYFSPHWKSMLGYEDRELTNSFKDWEHLIHPDDLEQVRTQLQSYLNGQSQIYQLEHRLRHKDGSFRWILARGKVLRDADGKPYRMVGSNTDITERKQAEEAIRQSEKRFSQAFQASPIPIVITALADGRYVEVNDAWLHLMGYARKEVIGKTSLELNVWAEPEERASVVQKLRGTGSLRNEEHLTKTRSGELRNVLLSAEVLDLNDQPHMLCFIYDITPLKQTQQVLEKRMAERVRELAALNEISMVVSRSLDLKEIMNSALKKAMELMNMDVGTAYSFQDSDEPDEEKLLVLAARHGLSAEFSRRVGSRRLGGTAIHVATEAQQPVIWLVANYPDPRLKEALEMEGVKQVINIPLFTKDRLVGAFNLGNRHERTITPEELSLLASIGRQIAIAVENAHLYDQAEQSAAIAERHRLSRELHDSVTQSLYSVMLFAEASARLLAMKDYSSAADHLNELRDTAKEALQEMRLLIFELRPSALEHNGLAAAIQARLDAVETRGGIKSQFHVSGDDHLSPAMQNELYHIAQEALNNTLKHAHASQVDINLSFSETCVSLQISDNGTGFDPANPGGGGLGLAGMRERAQRIGGVLKVESTIGKGTKVCVQVQPRSQAEDKLLKEGA